MNKIMQIATILLAVTVFAPAAVAQDCDNGTPDGDVNIENACQVCSGGDFIDLPDRTTCTEERRVECDGSEVWRYECVEVSCERSQRFGDVCPGGLTCDLTDGACLRSCVDTADCQTDFMCDEGVCRSTELPCLGGTQRSPDDGICYELCMDGTCRTGFVCTNDLCLPTTPPDMGQTTEDMGTLPADMGSQPDLGGESDLGSCCDLGHEPADSGSCAVSGGNTSSGAALLLLALVVLGRRRK